jgi:hypothetical protein
MIDSDQQLTCLDIVEEFINLQNVFKLVPLLTNLSGKEL